ncbi:MAG TPA: nickel insertion protein, partial [Candidatus Sulfotelmatobacter sp.]|nr:nickel insertion protein [Candidatus Sulfotelmatobacter sp.]
LMAAGALDVSITPVLMKKGRPGHLLSVMSPPDLVAKLSDHLLRHSTTLGVRLSSADRIVAARRIIEVTTRFGTARAKVKELNGKMIDVTPEYEDCRRISHETGAELTEVVRAVADAARAELGQ